MPIDSEARVYLALLLVLALMVLVLLAILRTETKRAESAERATERVERLLAYRRPVGANPRVHVRPDARTLASLTGGRHKR